LYQQHLARREEVLQALFEVPIRLLLDTQHGCHRGGDRRTLVGILEGHEEGAVGLLAAEPVGGGYREPRLAAPARPGQGHQPTGANETDDCIDRLLPPDK